MYVLVSCDILEEEIANSMDYQLVNQFNRSQRTFIGVRQADQRVFQALYYR